MSSGGTNSDLVKRRILADLRAVTPLATPWRRALVVLPVVVVAALAVGGLIGLRPDGAAFGVWGASAFFAIVAYGFFVLLAREVIPGLVVPLAAWVLVPLGVVAAQIVVTVLVHAESPRPVPEGKGVSAVVACTVAISVLALPLLAAGWTLARRALPLRVGVPALLAAVGSVVAGEAVWRLHCPYTSPAHFLGAHTPPYAVLAVLALVAFGRIRRQNRAERRL